MSKPKKSKQRLNFDTLRPAAEKFYADQAGLTTVLDSIDALVYVADMDSYEILFLNKYGREIWGEIKGRRCWETIQEGQQGPCAFCTNKKLLSGTGIPAGVFQWEVQNTKNGRWYECRDQAIRWTDGRLVRLEIATDSTERKRMEERERLVRDVLNHLNHSDSAAEMIRNILQQIKKNMGFEAVGMRLRESADFPYYETSGFPDHFVQMERSLCARDETGEIVCDTQGNPVLECMCGNVLCGRTNPQFPFFTEAGSFWSNSTTDLLASTTEKDRQTPTRNRCNGEGYESVALIPLLSGKEIIGLLQFNDHRRNQFTPEMICFFEGLGLSIGIALSRKRLEEALQENEAQLTAIFNAVGTGILVIDSETQTILEVNQTAAEMIGCSKEKIIGQVCHSFVCPAQLGKCPVKDLGQSVDHSERVLLCADGLCKDLLKSVYPITLNGKKCYLESFIDITDRKQAEQEKLELERRLLHAQRLESLGVLAGGIAHDFNNLLTGVLGNLTLALDDISPLSRAHPCIEDAFNAGKRAADLTHQMLAYSGKGRFFVKELNLVELVEENLHLLRTTIHKTIILNLQLDRNIPCILADAGQIQQVVMNLITNASESIGESAGTVTFSAGVQNCDEAFLSHSCIEENPAPGRFVWLEVTDTGCGMDEETQQRLFDPFFTTKFTGRGLGMSAVQGIVRGHHGALLVKSEVGKGTTIRVLFPASEPAQPAEDLQDDTMTAVERRENEASSFAGTILVVDDEEGVRAICTKLVARFGYRTLVAVDGEEAVTIFCEHADEIDCIILDLTMPKLDGLAALKKMSLIKPDVKAILCSGYCEQEATQHYSGHGLAGFIQKPYSMQSLRNILLRVLKGSS